MTTALEFYNELKKELSFLDENKSIKDEKIQLLEPQKLMLQEFFVTVGKRVEGKVEEKKIRDLIVDVLLQPNIENGKVYEALVYAWLEKNGVHYKLQQHINKAECFKEKDQGYDADGIIEENDIVFDVKQFGITLPHFETLRKKIQAKLPEGYYLTISGVRNISTKDLKRAFLEKIDDLAECIMEERNKTYDDYLYRDEKSDINFRAWKLREKSVFSTISEFDPYEWAENNQFYFMYHASQFCINRPYILFCPYDKCLAPIFSFDSEESTSISLRALCRRIFMNLDKMGEKKVSEFDGKARNDISISVAVKKISAIAFIDVSENQTNRMFVFENPNADNKIPKYQMNEIFRNKNAWFDDFQHDNY